MLTRILSIVLLGLDFHNLLYLHDFFRPRLRSVPTALGARAVLATCEVILIVFSVARNAPCTTSIGRMMTQSLMNAINAWSIYSVPDSRRAILFCATTSVRWFMANHRLGSLCDGIVSLIAIAIYYRMIVLGINQIPLPRVVLLRFILSLA